MAIIHDDGDSVEKVEVPTKPKRNGTSKKVQVSYKCQECKDTGLVEVRGFKVKCNCQVKKEFKRWLVPSVKRSMRGKPVTYIPSDSSESVFTGKLQIVFKDIPDKTVYTLLAKTLITLYYKNSMITFPYSVITGNDYTEAYVRGEHTKYLDTHLLVLLLGHDNKNVTLETTIKSIVQYRSMREIPTWIILKEGITHSKLSELYGIDFMEYIEDNTDVSVVKHGKGMRIIKKG